MKTTRKDSEIILMGVDPNMSMTLLPPEGFKCIQTEQLGNGLVLAEIVRREK